MRIGMICGSMEPGKDGVGDYSRLLAGELTRQGHTVAVMALHDRRVSSSLWQQQSDGVTSIETLRLPADRAWKERIEQARGFFGELDPDWMSLQFVPFSFSDKGLPFRLARRLLSIRTQRRWHVMAHELWGGINADKHPRVKERLLFSLQEWGIRRMLTALNPELVTTSNAPYQQSIRGFQAEILPLFGNIGVDEGKHAHEEHSYLQAVHFGSFSADTSGFRAQLRWLSRIAGNQGKDLRFVAFGNGGPHEGPSLAAAREVLSPSHVSSLGPLSESVVSQMLQMADFGVSRADGMLWGKSGTTAAMLEHGLPVVLRGSRGLLASTSLDVDYHDRLFFATDPDDLRLEKQKPRRGLPLVARRLARLMQTRANPGGETEE